MIPFSHCPRRNATSAKTTKSSTPPAKLQLPHGSARSRPSEPDKGLSFGLKFVYLRWV